MSREKVEDISLSTSSPSRVEPSKYEMKKNSWISIVCNDYGEEKETKRQMVQGRDKKKMCRFARCFFCLYLSSTMLRHVLSNFNVTHLSITIYFMCTCLFDRHRHCIVYTRHVDYEKSLSEK